MSRITLSGTLLNDARLLISPAGAATLLFEVAQAERHIAAQARWHLGAGPAAQHAAGNAARRFKRHTRVTIYAAGWDVERGAAPHLVLIGVERVLQDQVPAPRHQPADEAAA